MHSFCLTHINWRAYFKLKWVLCNSAPFLRTKLWIILPPIFSQYAASFVSLNNFHLQKQTSVRQYAIGWSKANYKLLEVEDYNWVRARELNCNGFNNWTGKAMKFKEINRQRYLSNTPLLKWIKLFAYSSTFLAGAYSIYFQ